MKPDTIPPCITPSLFQKVLLATDGTVGEILEVFAGEPIRVCKLSQEVGASAETAPVLNVAEHDQVLRRTVLLKGGRSGTPYIYAESSIRVDVLDPALLDALCSTDISIGQLLRNRRQETFREILASGWDEAGECALHFAIEPWDLLLWRTYRIVVANEPMMLITEKFPAHGALRQPGVTAAASSERALILDDAARLGPHHPRMASKSILAGP